MHTKKTYIDKDGYERFSDSGRKVHRWVAEKKLGRKLNDGEIVHHYDRNKRNNSPDNLKVLPNQKTHDMIHKYDAYRFGKKASYQGFNSGPKTKNAGCLSVVFFLIVSSLAIFWSLSKIQY